MLRGCDGRITERVDRTKSITRSTGTIIPPECLQRIITGITTIITSTNIIRSRGIRPWQRQPPEERPCMCPTPRLSVLASC